VAVPGHLKIVWVLLDYRADVNAGDKHYQHVAGLGNDRKESINAWKCIEKIYAPPEPITTTIKISHFTNAPAKKLPPQKTTAQTAHSRNLSMQ